MKKWTKSQKKILREYWGEFEKRQADFYMYVQHLESCMQKELGIKGLEFQHDEMCTGYFGIGNKWASKDKKYELWTPEK